jgi:hypothetical protein
MSVHGRTDIDPERTARLQVLNQVLGWEITTEEAASILGSSQRQTWRILAACRREGAAALAHGNRGRQPGNALPQEIRQRVLTLARTSYPGLNHSHLTDLLAEREGLVGGAGAQAHFAFGAGRCHWHRSGRAFPSFGRQPRLLLAPAGYCPRPWHTSGSLHRSSSHLPAPAPVHPGFPQHPWRRTDSAGAGSKGTESPAHPRLQP